MEKSNKKSIIAIAIVLILVAFGAVFAFLSSSDSEESELLNVVGTSTMIYDLVNVIGGDNVESVGLVGVGVDPHLYEASAGDISTMEKADVVVYNGINFEGQMGEVFSELTSQGKDIICLEDGIDADDLLMDDEGAALDPHIWFDISIWEQAAQHVAECLAEIDPDSADSYLENLTAYLVELEELEEYATSRIAEVDESQRVLITAHDAFNYFGKYYGFEVLGIQGISTESEASTSDISGIADYIVENEIKAIFVESSVSSKNIEALQEAVAAQGWDVEIGGELYSDSLGDEASGHDTYITMVMYNIDTIVDALK